SSKSSAPNAAADLASNASSTAIPASPMQSRAKGARGERQWRDELRANGFDARRGQQFQGSPDSPDAISHSLKGIHFEAKRLERLNIYDAMAQAIADAGPKVPVVAHRRNNGIWLVTIDATTFFALIREFNPSLLSLSSLPSLNQNQKSEI